MAEKKSRREKVFLAIVLIIVSLMVILHGRQLLPAGGYTCNANSDCESGVCVNGLCRESTTVCGDSFCDPEESCATCSTDCNRCKKLDGETCDFPSECESGICLHGNCRPTQPYEGDGWCDDGEDCWIAPKDCGECRWI